jgi:hypothetical protein
LSLSQDGGKKEMKRDEKAGETKGRTIPMRLTKDTRCGPLEIFPFCDRFSLLSPLPNLIGAHFLFAVNSFSLIRGLPNVTQQVMFQSLL